MKRPQLIHKGPGLYELPKTGRMLVPVAIFASDTLLATLAPSAMEQMRNVAALPGIVSPAAMMPDAHHGFGFPIGGVAAFDPKRGVVSAGGVGFDIGCGVRTLTTGLGEAQVMEIIEPLADALFAAVPTGAGQGGRWQLKTDEIDAMLAGGGSWAVGRGLGFAEDLGRMEDNGRCPAADPMQVSPLAKKRFKDQLGTLGSGNHYLEIQVVEEVLERKRTSAFGLQEGDVLVSIHCGSRGLGHQVAKDHISAMLAAAPGHRLNLPDRDLACAPLSSPQGRAYIGAMNAAINCALANRQAITQLVREVFADTAPDAALSLLCDVSHNTCRKEEHQPGGKRGTVFVHRKGATRAFGPGHPSLPSEFRTSGQPVLVGGSMGTASYVLAGTAEAMELSFGSACHGAGRALSRTQARKRSSGQDIMESLRHKGIHIRTNSFKGVAEEAPEAYKDISSVIDATAQAGLALPVARLRPLACIKG